MSSLGPYRFCETSPSDVYWQALRLDHSFIQLLCHGTLSIAGQMISFEQSFLLAKPGENRYTVVLLSLVMRAYSPFIRDASDPWPLLIVSHLLTVRDPSIMLKVV